LVDKKQAKDLMNRWLNDVVRKGDAENLDKLMTEDWIGHHPGRDLSLKEAKEMLRKHFTEVTEDDVIEDMIVSGDRIVVRWTERSTSRSTNEVVSNASVEIDRVRDGKFAETWYIWSNKPWLK
jgi:ketosteroid isomerase-like protein